MLNRVSRKGAKFCSQTIRQAESSTRKVIKHDNTKKLAKFAKTKFINHIAEYDGSCEDHKAEALANGASDVLVVRKSTGELVSSGWYGQIGKLNSVFQSRAGKNVVIFVNSVPARPNMVVCDSGTLQFRSGKSGYTMSSEDLEELNLKPGINEARYVCQELEEIIHFSVFLFDESDKFVLSDIDGTITESDIRGHISTFLGITSVHKNVVQLFDQIGQNGYKIIYLTARSMAQEEDTKHYLFKMLANQNGFSLPAGPVLFSPISFISGVIAEVVTKSPNIQKSKVIQEVWSLFESRNLTDINQTIVGCYGDKETDTKAYLDSGLSPSSVYIVNAAGELRNVGSGEVTNYGEQFENVNEMYPVLL